MPASADVNAGDDATAVQYNDLRADVVNVVSGHGHTGVSEDGKLIELDGLAQEVKDTLGSPASIQRFSTVVDIVVPGSGAKNRFELLVNQAITSIDLAKSYVVFQGFEIDWAATGLSADDYTAKAQLTSATNVEVIANVTATPSGVGATHTVTVHYAVVEWP